MPTNHPSPAALRAAKAIWVSIYGHSDSRTINESLARLIDEQTHVGELEGALVKARNALMLASPKPTGFGPTTALNVEIYNEAQTTIAALLAKLQPEGQG